jgi:hypothetical protein
MVPNELQEALHPMKRLYWALWAALTSAILLYFAVILLVARNEPDPLNAIHPTVRTVLILLAIGSAVGSFFFRKHNRSDSYLGALLGRENRLKDAEDRARKLIVQAETDPNLVSQLSLLITFDRKRYCLAADLFMPFVVNLALNETVAILGFALALPSRNVGIYIPFATVALLLNLYMRPDLSVLMERCEQWRVS